MHNPERMTERRQNRRSRGFERGERRISGDQFRSNAAIVPIGQHTIDSGSILDTARLIASGRMGVDNQRPVLPCVVPSKPGAAAGL